MRRHGTVLAVGISLLALLAAACSDVEEEPEVGGWHRHRQRRAVRRHTIVLAVNPWIGAKANAAVAQVLMEQQMGCTVELEDPIAEKAQFPAMADGDVDATLEVWPSGHADDYAQFIEEAGTVVDGGLLGITGNIGWFVPSYVVDENLQYATWRASRTTPMLLDRRHRRQGSVPRRGHVLDLRRADHRGARSRSRGHLQRQRGRVACAGHRGAEPGSHPDVLVDAAWANAKYDLVEVELPAFDDQCADIALNDPRPSATTATTPTTSSTRRSAPSWRRRTGRVRVPVELRVDRGDQNGVALAIQEGAEPEEAAQEWVDANQDVWQAWLPTA